MISTKIFVQRWTGENRNVLEGTSLSTPNLATQKKTRISYLTSLKRQKTNLNSWPQPDSSLSCLILWSLEEEMPSRWQFKPSSWKLHVSKAVKGTSSFC